MMVSMTVFLLVALGGCAPKKVSLYDGIPEMRGEVVRAAVAVHGRPYRSGAKGPDGFDCSGLVHYAYRQAGVLLPISTEGLVRMGVEVPPASVLPGDLVLFRLKGEYHVGIMLNRKEFIHASKSRGVAIDNTDASYWKRNFLAFRSVL